MSGEKTSKKDEEKKEHAPLSGEGGGGIPETGDTTSGSGGG